MYRCYNLHGFGFGIDLTGNEEITGIHKENLGLSAIQSDGDLKKQPGNSVYLCFYLSTEEEGAGWIVLVEDPERSSHSCSHPGGGSCSGYFLHMLLTSILEPRKGLTIPLSLTWG